MLIVINYMVLFMFYCVMIVICGFRQYKKGYKKGYEDGYKRQEYDFAKWIL